MILFDDESNMKIKTAGVAVVSPGSKVKSVHEAKADFKIELEGGSSATARPRPGWGGAIVIWMLNRMTSKLWLPNTSNSQDLITFVADPIHDSPPHSTHGHSHDIFAISFEERGPIFAKVIRCSKRSG